MKRQGRQNQWHGDIATVKKGVTDSQGEPWVGDWKYVPTKRGLQRQAEL
ncbi:putative prophage protein [Escherichia coli]|uniref:Putative prophage protein n=1 Tax=Escherichia coli TaxID=562 RepID=A0A3S4P2B5_ECOLX|nr:putative prophage protein [Escherichia coli]